MSKLAHAYRGGIAVARYADVDEITVGEISARGHGGHAAVHAVKAMRTAEKVGGCFG